MSSLGGGCRPMVAREAPPRSERAGPRGPAKPAALSLDSQDFPAGPSQQPPPCTAARRSTRQPGTRQPGARQPQLPHAWERQAGRALVAGTGHGQAQRPRRFSPGCSRMPAPSERWRWGIGGEGYFEPAIAPWAARGAIGRWRCRVSIGENLTAARRQAGLTITQVSQRTRVRETIIRGIERDDFSACGGDFYARGHIRAIARAAGADPEPLIREYDAVHGAPAAIRAAEIFEPATPIRLNERRPPNWTLAMAVVLVLLLSYGAYRLVSAATAGRTVATGRKPVAAPPDRK